MDIHSKSASSLWGRNLFGQAAGIKANAPTGSGTFFKNPGADAEGAAPGAATAASTAPPLKPVVSIPGTSTASAGFFTQSIAQAPDTPASPEKAAALDAKATSQSAQDKFMDFVHKDPMERLRDQILHDMGVTEDQIKGMSAEEQAKVEEKIREKIQEALKKKMDNAAAKDPADTTLATMAAAI